MTRLARARKRQNLLAVGNNCNRHYCASVLLLLCVNHRNAPHKDQQTGQNDQQHDAHPRKLNQP
ncbi:hypothetical protein UUU_08780 [Klebsiella pneumoniae subsp. pneumoniae DSM 30104 = JCM 1662 = NBRC 14940]|nr:hypothetical protein UUU_08780 [Klebsiella pneumoniae subsp. pneumoniae DSM 30104 = JCM 1662 = NBRC 14940]